MKLKDIFSVYNRDNKKIIKILGREIETERKLKSLKDSVTIVQNMEKDIISKSYLWDAEWYVREYNHNFSRFEALDYWYNEGWQKGENPSKYMDLYFFPYQAIHKNPIIAYLEKNKEVYFYPHGKNPFKCDDDKKRIEDYLEYKKTRTAKNVVYTCITNDYDDLEEIDIYKYIDKDWDYICFTDNQEHLQRGHVGIWETRPLVFNELDNTRNNRWHKLHPHVLFPNCEESVYIDSNINILTDKLFQTLKERDEILLLPKHFKDTCIYQEYDAILEVGVIDNAEDVKRSLEVIKKDGMPRNFGFAENNVIYRKHHNEKIIKIMDEWWYMIQNYSKRDQLSFVYVLWKNDINLDNIKFENTRLDVENYYLFQHKGALKK